MRNSWDEADVTLYRNGKPAENAGGRLLKFNTAKDRSPLGAEERLEPVSDRSDGGSLKSPTGGI